MSIVQQPTTTEAETLRQERDRIKANIHAAYGPEIERLLKEHKDAKTKTSPAEERAKHLDAILDNRTPLRQQVRSVQDDSIARLIEHTQENATEISPTKTSNINQTSSQARLEMLLKMKEEHESPSRVARALGREVADATFAADSTRAVAAGVSPVKVSFCIVSCSNLPEVEDVVPVTPNQPFVKVLGFDRKPILSTQVVRNTSNPTWSSDAATVGATVGASVLGGDGAADSSRFIEFQVWSWGPVTNLFLGGLRLTEKDVLEGPTSETKVYPLVYDVETGTTGSLGTIEITIQKAHH